MTPDDVNTQIDDEQKDDYGYTCSMCFRTLRFGTVRLAYAQELVKQHQDKCDGGDLNPENRRKRGLWPHGR